MKIFKDLKAKYEQKEKLQDLINRRESTMHNLLVGLATEESIEMFNEISVLFVSKSVLNISNIIFSPFILSHYTTFF